MRLYECDATVGPDGTLVLEGSGAARSRGEIGCWSSGLPTTVVRNNRTVVSYFWSLELISPDALQGVGSAVAAFVGAIPSDIRQRIGAYRFGQCLMLQNVAQHTEAADLLHGNPNLYWLMACGVYEGRIDPQEIPALCRRRQIDILRRLLRPASAAALRLLRKTIVDEGTLTESRSIVEALSRPAIVAAAAHQKRMPAALLAMLLRYPRLVDRHLVDLMVAALLSADEDLIRRATLLATRFAQTCDDIRRMAATLGVERPDRAIAVCRSVADVHALHDRWVERVNRDLALPAARIDARPEPGVEPRLERHLELRTGFRARLASPLVQGGGAAAVELVPGLSLEGIVFPAPPFPDSTDIVAITSVEELVREGREQQNCVASYAPAVAAGELYIYRVLRPRRATLEIRRTGDGWEIGQLKYACNRDPDVQVRLRVGKWFSACARDASSSS